MNTSLKMNRKAKGIGAERELIHMFWGNSWAAVRVAGSGSMKYPSPDILASNNKRKLGIECKASKNKHQYLTKEEVMELKQFCSSFGLEPWIGVRFGKDWYFLSLDDLNETSKNFSVSSELAKQKGLTFNELIGFI
jgi:Holliday junction resolvase